MSFQKNPPWLSNQNQKHQTNNLGIPNFQQQMNLQQFNQQQILQQQYGAFQQFTGLVGSQAIQYPPTRVNALAFQQQQQQQPAVSQNNQATQPPPSGQSKYNANLKVFSGTGVVSKIQNDIGFIDDEVLFHKNVCVKGLSPKLGDHVLVEAAYNQNMPFKWNATRVQVLQSRTSAATTSNAQDNKSYNQRSGGGGENSGEAYRNRRYSPERDRRNEVTRRARSRDNRDTDDENERKRRREDRERERAVRQRETSIQVVEHTNRDKTKSPLRRSSPKRRRTHNIPRYMVQIPKISLSLANIDIFEIKRRYQSLYIPSDFVSSDNKWITGFPFHKPFSIQKPCSFHIMRDVNPIDESVADCSIDPSDADYSWSAKVMLLSVPTIQEIYKKCIIRAEDNEKHDEPDKDFIHPSRLISFLVGVRGKNETMAIGGAWSKKLDGENPESDPSVLIRTAIRTCKGLTGIDLSKCTQWYRFVELKYRRSEQIKKEGDIKPARIETVVIFLPDIHLCMPNRIEWEGIQQQYKQALEKIITADTSSASKVDNADSTASKEVTPSGETKSEDSSTDVEIITADIVDVKQQEDVTMAANDADEALEGDQKDISIENADVNEDGEEKSQTEVSDLDPKNMKVTELRAELVARNLSTKGLKNELVDRLTKALNPESENVEETAESMETDTTEQEPEKTNVEKVDENLQTKCEQEMELNISEMDISEVTVIDEYDSTKCDEEEKAAALKKKLEPKKMDEKERHMWEKRYQLPENQHIIVHPSKTAKSGKFDCAVVSLSLLLDYRKDDTKEHSFEISLFAEAFNEMLMRDFGFNIYRAFNFFHLAKPKEVIKEDDKKKESKADGETVDNEKSSDATEHDEKDKAKNKKTGDKRLDDSDDQSESSRRRDKERIKYTTAFPDLLLSFNYFDQTQCGYIFEKDIEDLFHCLGLNLSRSQVRKLTEKFITRDSFYYRKMTDRQIDAPFVNPLENVTDEQMAQLAQGNKPMNDNKTGSSMEISQSNEIVTFEGITVNVPQVLTQMKRSEAAYEESEKLLVDLRKNNSELKSVNHKNEKRIKDLNSDLKSISRKLQDAESSLNNVTRKYNDCFSTLTSINERIQPIISRNERSRDREKERSDRSKSEKKSKDENKSTSSSSDKVEKTEKSVKTEKKDGKDEPSIDKEKHEDKQEKVVKDEIL